MAVVLHLMVLICSMAMAMGAAANETETLPPLNLDPNPDHPSGHEYCTTSNNKTGICVHYSTCNETNKVIEIGGNLHDSDWRTISKCGYQKWCCSFPESEVPESTTIGPPNTTSNNGECLAPEVDSLADCPWCALLYENIDKMKAGRPFCLGALIGSSTILTSSTCLLKARKKTLHVQVPNSANPGNMYKQNRPEFHPNYNSGSHAYDFGILVLEGEVTFDKGKARGACLNFDDPLEGKCVGYGIDDDGKIRSTSLDVKKNSCHMVHGKAIDAACGSHYDQECRITSGSPVLCPNKKKLFISGIARRSCRNGKVQLGDISHSKTWIEKELSSLNISKDVYSRDHESPAFIYRRK